MKLRKKTIANLYYEKIKSSNIKQSKMQSIDFINLHDEIYVHLRK